MELGDARTARSGMCRPSMKTLAVASRHSGQPCDSKQAAESVTMQRRARLSLLSVGIRAGLPTDRFFLCELKKHPEGELVEKAPSQAGKKSKKTNHGEQCSQ
jgi:hypothetical protein